MASFSFISASDLHIDSPLAQITATDPEVTQAARLASYTAFDRLMDLCVDRQVDFLLLAGDVFDDENRSLKAQLAFRDGMARLARHGISVFVAHGNHDPLQGKFLAVQWPSNVHIFRPDAVETLPVERKGELVAQVSGISYAAREETRNLASLFPITQDHTRAFHIGLMHSNVGSDTSHAPYAPCALNDLKTKSVDFWALGHVHSRHVLLESPYAVYPGNIQGRGFHEAGPKGVFYARVDGRHLASLEFCQVDSVRFARADVAADSLGSILEMENALHEAINSLAEKADGRPLVCGINLAGRSPLFHDFCRTQALSELLEHVRDVFSKRSPFVFVQDIHSRVLPTVDLEERKKSKDLLGEALRIADEIQGSKEQLRAFEEEALSVLFSNKKVVQALGQLKEEPVAEILEQARNLCVDLFEGDGA